MKAPAFWSGNGPAARLLAPAGAAYAAAGAVRWALARQPEAPLPVWCVGNATLGGTGKTPVTLDLLARLRARGRDVHALCRGHGGRVAGSVRVDPSRHDEAEVGDEALLLAAAAPTWAGPDRLTGAREAARAGADAAVLDDGLQYPALAKHAAALVVDAETGFGNGRVVPAGPLREPLARARARADVAIVMGPGPGPAGLGELPVLRADLAPAAAASQLAGRRVLAFAGIGRPAKFFATARALGVEVAESRAFADHHRFTTGELDALEARAAALGAALLTTAKDAVRLPAGRRSRVAVLDVRVVWERPDRLEEWLDKTLAAV